MEMGIGIKGIDKNSKEEKKDDAVDPGDINVELDYAPDPQAI